MADTAWGVVEVRGADARTLLQGQLTQDMSTVIAGRVPLTAWCNPKGRALAVARVIELDDAHFALLLPASMIVATAQRLGMFVLRAAARVSAGDEPWHHTVLEPGAATALAERFGVALPDSPDEAAIHGRCRLVGLHGGGHLLCAPVAETGDVALPADPDRSRLIAGLPSVFESTREAFVPLMLNLDLLAGIGFTKGCYTGQEIIARTRNLGRIKRRMMLLECAPEALPATGAPVFGAGGATAGQVVEAAADRVLAVISLEQARGALFTDTQGRHRLTPQPLPYPVPELANAA